MKPVSLFVFGVLVLMVADTPLPQGARTMSDALADRGDLLFRDSFSDGVRPEWQFDRDSVWSIRDGHLRAEMPEQRQLRSFAFMGNPQWRDYALDFDVCGMRGVDKGVAIRVDGDRKGVGIDLRGPRYNDILMYRGFEQWGRAPIPNTNGTWYHLHIEARKNRYRVFVDGELQIDFMDELNSRPRGRVALAAYTGGVGACVVLYDNVEVRAIR